MTKQEAIKWFLEYFDVFFLEYVRRAGVNNIIERMKKIQGYESISKEKREDWKEKIELVKSGR